VSAGRGFLFFFIFVAGLWCCAVAPRAYAETLFSNDAAEEQSDSLASGQQRHLRGGIWHAIQYFACIFFNARLADIRAGHPRCYRVEVGEATSDILN